MSGTTTLLYRFLGIDEGAGAQFDRMSAKTRMLGDSSIGALTKLRTLAKGATLAGVVIAAGAIKMAGDFQTSMLRIQTQANQSAKTVAILSKGILSMAGSVAETPNQLAAAEYHIASIGQHSLTTAQQLRVLRIATEGAKIGGADLVDVTNALDAAIVSHIQGVKNYSQAMGALNATVGAGDMTMQDLADAFGPLGSVFKGFNVSLQQAGAALAVFGDNNHRGQVAGNQLRMTITALADPLKFGQEQLQKWGIASGNLAKQLQRGGLTSALDVLAKKLHEHGYTAKTMGPILAEMFGKRGPQIGLSTLINQLDRFHTKLGEVAKGATGFAGSWKAYTKSFGYAWDSAKASAESLMIQLGEKLLPIATKVMNWISTTAVPALEHFGEWLKKNAAWTKPLGIALAALAIALETGPIGAIAELVIGLVILYKKSETFRTIVQDVARVVVASWQWMKAAGLAVWHAIGAVIQWFTNGPVAWVRARLADFSTWYNAHAQQIREVTHAIWFAISLYVKTNIRVIMDIVKPALVFLKAAFKVAFIEIWGSVKLAFRLMGDVFRFFQHQIQNLVAIVLDIVTGKWGKAWDDAKKLVSQAFSDIGKIFSDFAKGALNLLYDAGRAIIQGLINGVKSMAGSAWDAVKNIGSSVVSGFKHFFHIGSPSKLFHQFGIWIVEGLVSGVKSYTINARNVAQELAIGFLTGWKDGTSSLKNSLVSPVQAALEQLTTVVETAIKNQQTRLKTAQTALASLLKQRQSAITSLSGNIAGVADLSGLFGTDANGNPMVNNIDTFLSSQASQIENFAKDLKWAARHGLSGVLLSEIAGLGSVQGDQVLKQFMSGQASIGAANSAEAAVQRFSTGAATAVEDSLYAKKVAADRKAVYENTVELRKLTQALHAIERQTARQASMHLTVDARTGRPTVDQKFIQEIIQGIRKAERTAGKKLL